MAWTAYTTRWLDARISSDAAYRERGKWISDRLTDLGWGKTADTGQIDWATAIRAGAPTLNTKGGYEIRVSSGAGTDVYFKITYGTGYVSGGPCIGLWIATGEGSDGAGTLTGDQTTERQVGSALASGSPYESTWYLAGDSDNLTFGATNENNSQNGVAFGVQRSCDASGVDTSSGWFIYYCCYSGAAVTSGSQYVGFSTGAAAADVNPGVGIPYLSRIVVSSECPTLYLPMLVQNGSVYSALRDAMVHANGSAYGISDISHYGATRRYVNVMMTNNALLWGFTATFSPWFAIRIA